MESSASIELQHAFLAEFINCGGGITNACAAAGIDRETFFNWLLVPSFDELYQSAREAVIDSYDEELHRAIQDGNRMALIFFMATKGKDRGYGMETGELAESLNLELEKHYLQENGDLRKLVEEQGEVICEARDYIKKLKSRIIELEQVKADATN